MQLTANVGLFGTRTRTRVLLLIYMLDETHAAELARILDLQPNTIHNAIDSLERVGVVAGRFEGKARRVRLNPRYYALEQLLPLLEKVASSEPDLSERLKTLRRRPRRLRKKL